jgi:hypothetical protein
VLKINFLLFSVILNIIFLAALIAMFYIFVWKKRKRKDGYVWVGEGEDPFTGKKEDIWKK